MRPNWVLMFFATKQSALKSNHSLSTFNTTRGDATLSHNKRDITFDQHNTQNNNQEITSAVSILQRQRELYNITQLVLS